MFILKPQFLWFFFSQQPFLQVLYFEERSDLLLASLLLPRGWGIYSLPLWVIFRSEVYFFFISFAESASFFLPSQQLYCNSPALLMFFNLALYRCESLVIIQFKRAWLFPKYNKKPLQPLTYYYVLFRLLRFQ